MERIVLLLLAFWLVGSAELQTLPKPALQLMQANWNEFEIYAGREGNIEYTYHERHNSSHKMTDLVTMKFGRFKVEVLQPNTAYSVRARFEEAGNFSVFSEWLTVRTAPGQAKFTYLARPTFVILMLEQIPGAIGWEVEYSALEHDSSVKAFVPYSITTSYYVVVINNLRADHVYGCSVRVSRIAPGVDLNELQSPFGNLGNFKTTPLSVFGRVLLPQLQYNSTSIDNIKTEISGAYTGVSGVEDVNVLEVENGTNGQALVHYELFIKEKSVKDVVLSKYELTDGEDFKNSKIHLHVTGTDGYFYGASVGAGLSLFPNFTTRPNCTWTETRNWTLFNYDRWQEHLMLSSFNNATTNVQFQDRELLINGNQTLALPENSVVAIGHNYLVKGCPSNENATSYGRLYTASAANLADRYAIIYTTGPGAIPSDDALIGIGPAESNRSQHRVVFSVPGIPRAVRYDFSVATVDGRIVENITLPEDEIDSSTKYKVTTKAFLFGTVPYILTMKVTTRLANGTTTESPTSSVMFYTDLPKPNIRVTAVHVDNFTVSWPAARRATGYRIRLKDSHGNTTLIEVDRNTTRRTVAVGINSGGAYDVSVAAQNEFGLSEFSDQVSTKIWNFSEVSETSFAVSWLNQSFVDARFIISINKTLPNQILTQNYSALISGLLTGTKYRVTVTYNSSETDWSTLFDTFQYTVPAAPTNLATTFIEHNFTIPLTWNQSRGADRYDVKCTSSPQNQSFVANDLGSTSYELRNVSADRTYECGVRAVNDAGKSSTVRVWQFTGYPVPRNVIITNVTSSSVSLSWDYIRGATAYKILTRSGLFNRTSSFASHKDNLVNGLDAGTTYNFSVMAQYRNDSHWSPAVAQFTAAANPSSFTDVLVNRSTANLSWNAPQTVGNVSYKLILRAMARDGAIEKEEVVASNSGLYLDYLMAGTEYLISLYTITHFDLAHQTDFKNLDNPAQITILTAASNPTHLRYTEVNTTSITAQWIRPPFNGTLEYRVKLLLGGNVLFNSTVAEPKYTFTSLEAGTQYTVQAITISLPMPANKGKYQNEEDAPNINVTTVPNPPTDLNFQGYDVRSANLTWRDAIGATLYVTTLKAFTSDEQLNAKTYNTTSPGLHLTGLDSSASWFTAEVQALNIHGLASKPSAVVTQDAAARNPTGLSFDGMTTDSISLSWTPAPFDRAVNFSISIFNETNLLRDIDAGPNKAHTITGLGPGLTYRMRVATNTALVRPKKVVYLNMREAPEIRLTTVPKTPVGLTASVNGSRVMISWDPSAGATSYQVGIKVTNTETLLSQSADYKTNDTVFAVTKHETSIYSITVSAINIHGYASSASDPVTLGKPAAIECCGPIPWWAILAASVFMFVALTAVIVHHTRRRRSNKNVVGSYEMQSNPGYNSDEASENSEPEDSTESEQPNTSELPTVSGISKDDGGVLVHNMENSPVVQENVPDTQKSTETRVSETDAQAGEEEGDDKSRDEEEDEGKVEEDGSPTPAEAADDIGEVSDEADQAGNSAKAAILDAAAIIQEIEEMEQCAEFEIQEGETEVEFQQRIQRSRLKFSCKGKPGNIAIVDRTFIEDV